MVEPFGEGRVEPFLVASEAVDEPFSGEDDEFELVGAGVADAGPFAGIAAAGEGVHAGFEDEAFGFSPDEAAAFDVEPEPDFVGGVGAPAPAAGEGSAVDAGAAEAVVAAPPLVVDAVVVQGVWHGQKLMQLRLIRKNEGKMGDGLG